MLIIFSRVKGSDASGVFDTEVPLELQEFSDDEQERDAKNKHSKKRGMKQPVASAQDTQVDNAKKGKLRKRNRG